MPARSHSSAGKHCSNGALCATGTRPEVSWANCPAMSSNRGARATLSSVTPCIELLMSGRPGFTRVSHAPSSSRSDHAEFHDAVVGGQTGGDEFDDGVSGRVSHGWHFI